MKLLNVGAGSREISLPKEYAGWDLCTLDIDPSCNPDILADARDLHSLPLEQFDAIYCSHNLEHYYSFDVRAVLEGFLHVLNLDGFIDILVPDLSTTMDAVAKKELNLDDVLYNSPMGPIRVIDVIYGHQSTIEKTKQTFYAHKTGFDKPRLTNLIMEAGFRYIYTTSANFELRAIAFHNKPSSRIKSLFKLPDHPSE